MPVVFVSLEEEKNTVILMPLEINKPPVILVTLDKNICLLDSENQKI